MSNIMDKLGLQLELRRELELRDKAMSGDMVWVVDPATTTKAPTAAAWTRNVYVELQTAAGEKHTWFSKAITTGVSIADTSALGTATIPSTTLTVSNGRARVVVSGSAAAWLDTETNTLTIAQATILGNTVAAKASVETITA